MSQSAVSLSYERLAPILETRGYPADRYKFGHRGQQRGQAFVADRSSNCWVVYYTERGGKWDIRNHKTEDAACRDLLARLGVQV